MSQQIDQTTTFLATPDPLYSASEAPVSVDADTESRLVRIIVPNSGGSSSVASGGLRGSTSHWEIFNGSNHKIRWATSALRIGLVFTNSATPGVAAPNTCSPPWNLVGSLIHGLKLGFNSANDFYSTSGGTFAHIFTANMLRFYSKDALDQMSNTLFTPLPNESDSYNHVAADAAGALAGTAVARNANWIGADSHTRTVYKTIPLSMLFPRFPDAIINNLSKVTIDINWTQASDLLENADVLTAANHGRCWITSADIVLDSYVMSASSSIQEAVQKRSGKSDMLAYLEPSVTPYMVPGTGLTTVMLSSIKNLDAVCLLCPNTTYASNGDPIHGSTANLAEAGRHLFTSSGEYSMFGNFGAAAATASTRAATALTPLSSVQLDVGGMVYPSSMINTLPSGTTIDSSLLYIEYLRARGGIQRRELGPPISEGVFRSVLPFVMLRPWSDSAAHLTNEGKDVRIYLSGGVAGAQIFVVAWRLRVLVIRPDGSIGLNQ